MDHQIKSSTIRLSERRNFLRIKHKNHFYVSLKRLCSCFQGQVAKSRLAPARTATLPKVIVAYSVVTGSLFSRIRIKPQILKSCRERWFCMFHVKVEGSEVKTSIRREPQSLVWPRSDLRLRQEFQKVIKMLKFTCSRGAGGTRKD